MQNLKTTKSTGLDGNGNYVPANAAPSLLKSVKSIFSTIPNKGTFPEQWKLSRVTPVHKDGDKYIIEKYHQISVLCNFSKAFEKLLFDELCSSINEHLHDRQVGFRKHRSAYTQLLTYLNKVYTLYDQKEITTLASLSTDFSKALDKVTHVPLIEKLLKYGIGGKLLNFLGSYLTNRFQFVMINESTSKGRPVTSGIPQGSIVWATTAPRIHQGLRIIEEGRCNWCSDNSMELNAKKFNFRFQRKSECAAQPGRN